MIRYSPDTPITDLEDWPFDNPASAYKIIQGSPRASGRMDTGGPGHPTRSGIWRCTKGAFECIEQGDELMTVLSGSGQLINHSRGETVALSPGVTLFINDQSHVTWQIDADLTKVFFAHKPDGY